MPALATPPRRWWRGAKRLLRAFALVTALLALMACVRLPDALVRRLLRPQPDARFVAEIGKLHYAPFEGLVAEHVKLHRRQWVGPAVFECDRLVVGIRPSRLLRNKPWIRRVQMTDGIFRPDVLRGAFKGPMPNKRPGDGSPMLLGTSISIQRLRMFGVVLERAEARLEGTTDAWSLERIQARLTEGGRELEGSGRLVRAGTGFRAEGDGRGDPDLLVPIFKGCAVPAAPKIIQDFAFTDALPRFTWNYDQSLVDAHDFRVGFHFWMERARYRGVSALRADGQVELQGGRGTFLATVRPLMVAREEGTGQGGFTIRWERDGDFRLDYEAVSALEPRATSGLIGVLTNVTHTLAGFEGPYLIDSRGWVDLHHPERHALEARVSLGNLKIGKHDFRNLSFRYLTDGVTNRVEQFAATWFSGALTADLEWRRALPPAPTWARLSTKVEGADFENLMLQLAPESARDYAGRLSGQLAVEGLLGAAHRETLRGEGALRISRGRLFQLPVFGGLTEYISWAIPGAALVLGQTDARCAFAVADGRFKSDRIQIEGDVLSLLGKGSYGMDGSLEADVQLTFLRSHTFMSKLIRVPTYLVSKLLEFRLSGTSADPRWFPVNFSKQVWYERVGGASGDTPPGAEAGDEEPAKRRFWWPFRKRVVDRTVEEP